MRIGLEIESIVNNEIMSIAEETIGRYHHPTKKNVYWRMEKDSSLHGKNKFDYEETIEFTSIVIKPERFRRALDSFKEIFKGYELNKVLDFNDTCGCHIHISMEDESTFTFRRRAVFGIFSDVRKEFFRLLKKNEKLSQEVKDKIRKHYFRHYAQAVNEDNYRDTSDKYREFNLRTEEDGTGIEWRSFNLLGVTTWDEFFEVFEMGRKCVMFLRDKIMKGCSYSSNLKIPEKIKEEIEEVKVMEVSYSKNIEEVKVIKLSGEEEKEELDFIGEINNWAEA